MTKIYTVILNRNLPEPTDSLYEHLIKYDSNNNDTYVIEAGSDKDKLSKYCSWYADEPEIIKNGLRYGRGMNYALLKLFKEEKWEKYEAAISHIIEKHSESTKIVIAVNYEKDKIKEYL